MKYHIEDHYLVAYGEEFDNEQLAQQECDYLNNECDEEKYFVVPH